MHGSIPFVLGSDVMRVSNSNRIVSIYSCSAFSTFHDCFAAHGWPEPVRGGLWPLSAESGACASSNGPLLWARRLAHCLPGQISKMRYGSSARSQWAARAKGIPSSKGAHGGSLTPEYDVALSNYIMGDGMQKKDIACVSMTRRLS